MKKIVWIISINADGVYPFGYVGITVSPKVALHPKQFQKKLKASFEPEYDLEFVSYNLVTPKTPIGDFIVYNERDSKYLDEDTKRKGIEIPFLLFYEGEVEKIKNYIESQT
ncbi:hypothetical protein [Enterococcus xiangfangensis]|uniref:Uncharacterized protein n=1 Tax=Enterococcus xiangfangensis TaxID=1296537 RepID=A0ABU3FDE0_9ENTE|nr:hypothetical protein [Enterococcus xiangfangensis]MDT2760676.1 hypothetical protein [Enterococcus xiangfangensis]NBK07501.1 hypothetical protein [Enterococcus asini]